MPAIAAVLADVAAAACRDPTVALAAGVSHDTWAACRSQGGRVFDADDPWRAAQANCGRTPYVVVSCETVAVDQRQQGAGIALSRVTVEVVVHRLRHAPAAARAANILDACATAIRSLPSGHYAAIGDDEYLAEERHGSMLRRSVALSVQHAADREDAGGVVVVPDGGSDPTGQTFTAVNLTGTTLSGHRVVTVDESTGGLIYADSRVIAHAGAVLGVLPASVALHDVGEAVQQGEMYEPSWSWQPGREIFLGADGHLVHYAALPAGRLFERQVANALTPQRIFVDDEPAFVVEP